MCTTIKTERWRAEVPTRRGYSDEHYTPLENPADWKIPQLLAQCKHYLIAGKHARKPRRLETFAMRAINRFEQHTKRDGAAKSLHHGHKGQIVIGGILIAAGRHVVE